jgi:hypothetical protein
LTEGRGERTLEGIGGASMARKIPGKVSLNVYVSEETHRGLRMLSAASGKPIGDILAEVVEDFWANHPNRKQIEKTAKVVQAGEDEGQHAAAA